MVGRVLLTGASGLLGRAVYAGLKADPKWEVCGLAFSRSTGQLLKVDLTNSDEVQRVMDKFKPTVVIHCAAERRPDVVEKDEESTAALNVTATKVLCQLATDIGAYVVYISTEYVFDGTRPPYKETDQTNPLNKYGRSKLQGETITLQASKDNISLRIPILYGEVENLDESAVTTLFSKVKDTGQSCHISNYERRYPTYTGDVAEVLRQIITYKTKNRSLNGILHWSGSENMTKYDMAIAMAQTFNLPTQHIIAVDQPSSGTPRPYNSHLDTARLQQLGIGKQTAFAEGIRTCLTPFFKH